MRQFATSIRQAFPDDEHEFDRVESESTEWVRRLEEAEEAVARGFARAEQNRQNNVEFLVGISAVGLAGRIRQQLDAVVALVNQKNCHASPPVARALFEACCVPIYLERELLPRVGKGRIDTVREIVFKLGVGGIGALGGGPIKPIKVDALISAAREQLKQLEEALPEEDREGVEELIEIYYGPLTELTHPNWAALTLGTRLGMPPQFQYPAPIDDSIIHFVVASSAYGTEAGGLAFDRTLVALRDTPFDLPNMELP
jgi:hypothetical protein